MPVETGVRDAAVGVDAQVDLDVVAAEGVVIRKGNIVRVKVSPIGRFL